MKQPKATEPCPLCKAEPNKPHQPNCPWVLWATGKGPLPTRDTEDTLADEARRVAFPGGTA
jgi:hypothetical protein